MVDGGMDEMMEKEFGVWGLGFGVYGVTREGVCGGD